MVRAFIMVKAATGETKTLSETLGGVDHVTEANVVAGDFDVIVEAEAGEVYEIIDSVSARIRELESIVDTKTYICLE
ncbi:Lrp/AsnC ligand binding domain-containing protein [Natronomonas sp. F2-12]|jgi:DNA-binding Lrp family transcriptional regulator|uniref:Lrp/AsnC ligand binding domain-containing protein n=1 Tax=Natronomonas aquatica TaxID=2841590 RepID=A0A9R1CRW4_9EURY|nr:Lrp/AsnC ligand binding domain-containing protein [Natronomonas aquatica]MCQ4332688.1 Lrp/AsnC ligand binding domain-containing protein [Natronomonas aquatica]